MTKKRVRPARSKKKSGRNNGLLTRRELAGVLGVHPMTVTKWEQDGMPITKRGRAGKPSEYREVDARAWLQLRDETAKQPGAVNLVAERARKERAQAVLAEQAYSIRMRDLLPREEVAKIWSGEVAAVRTKLLSWPATLADQLYRRATTDGLPGVEQVLRDAVRDVLRELADPERPLPEVTPPHDGETVAA